MVFQCMNPAYTNRIDREMNRLLSNLFGEAHTGPRSGSSPPVNVWEKDDAWRVEMEIPGVTEDQLDVSVVNDELTISVNRPEAESDGVAYLRRERTQGPLARTLQLPAAVDAQHVEADLVHGVLTVTLPKAEAARGRKIEVNARS